MNSNAHTKLDSLFAASRLRLSIANVGILVLMILVFVPSVYAADLALSPSPTPTPTPVVSVTGSIRIDAEGEGVEYNNQLTEWDAGGITMMAWVYVVHDRSGGIPTADADMPIITVRGAGILYLRNMKLRIYTGDSQSWDNNTFIPLSEWHHFALVRVGGTHRWRAYVDGVLDIEHDALVEPSGDPRPYFGTNQYAEWLDGRIAAGKIWLATLTTAEIQAEMGSCIPVRTANIWSVVPMRVHTDLADRSGQGNTPVAMGKLSTEEGPPWQRHRQTPRVLTSRRCPS